jgi:excisionase family DNA binding protein
MKPLLGIETAARMAGFSQRHFRRLISEDRIRVIQIGRKMFILSSDLSEWAKNRNLGITESDSPLPTDGIHESLIKS